MTAEREQAASFFLPQREIAALKPLGGGIVNDTCLVTLRSGEKYVLQRLNPAVFPDPRFIQSNLLKITSHFQAQLHQLAHSHERIETDFRMFQPVSNDAGEISYVDGTGAWWRLLTYIDNSRSLSTISGIEQAREIGAALGLFHQLVSTLPADSLADSLPGFHDTPLYLARYDALLSSSVLHPEAEDCRQCIHQRRTEVSLLENARKRGRIRQQVIHGDPKVANFLFSTDTNRVISLIDLDTVKPGLLLHDIGDCLRSCCNPLGEEVQTPNDIVFDRELFTAVLKGYLSCAADLLTPEDRRLIVDSARLISFELGLRFYSDYLAGNCSFKVDYREHNLFRARVQFALVRSLEQQYNELVASIKQCLRDHEQIVSTDKRSE